VLTLLMAWQRLQNHIPLRLIGGGPQLPAMQARAEQMGISSVRFDGVLPHDEVLTLLKRARFLLFTSEWYETFGMGMIEAFACGVPVICSRLGAMQEIVADGRTGLHFAPGDPEDLAKKVHWAWTHPQEMAEMGRAARAEYEAKYTAERNCAMLMQIYRRALDKPQAA
jgi:glycosyltransferase involved in cell wall biosynthesis